MRYRDLETGSFITRDPLGFVDGPNLYSYVRQNPWTAFDPEGLQTARELMKDELSEMAANGDQAAAKDLNQIQRQEAQFNSDVQGLKAATNVVASLNPVQNVITAATGKDSLGDNVSGFEQTAAIVAVVAGPAEKVASKVIKEVAAGVKIGKAAEEGAKIEKSAQTVAKEAENIAKGEEGVVYKVSGKDTPSGEPYIGRTSHPDGPPGRGKVDGRDRTNAEIVDKYTTTKEGKVKEQKAMDVNGGVKKLDNKRNEIAPSKRKDYGLDQ